MQYLLVRDFFYSCWALTENVKLMRSHLNSIKVNCILAGAPSIWPWQLESCSHHLSPLCEESAPLSRLPHTSSPLFVWSCFDFLSETDKKNYCKQEYIILQIGSKIDNVFTNAPDNGQFQWWPSSQRQIPWYNYTDLVTRNVHVEYESSNIYYFVINNIYLSKKCVKCQGQKFSANKKILSRKIFMWNMKTLAGTHC